MRRLIYVVVAGLIQCGCELGGGSTRPLVLDVFVESDPGLAVSGVSVSIDGQHVGATGSSGRVRTSRQVTPGQLLALTHTCPTGFTQASEPRVLRARSFSGGEQDAAVSLTLRCRPERRLAIFVIRTQGVGEVEVFINGESAATTDTDGVAHISRQANPGSDFFVELMTRTLNYRPKKVSRVFTLRDSDEIFVFDQRYRARAVRRRVSDVKPRIVRIE